MVFEQLERRVLLSADPALDPSRDLSPDAGLEPASGADALLGQAEPELTHTLDLQAHLAERTTEVFFIDSRVPDALALIEDLQGRADKGYEIILLDAVFARI